MSEVSVADAKGLVYDTFQGPKQKSSSNLGVGAALNGLKPFGTAVSDGTGWEVVTTMRRI